MLVCERRGDLRKELASCRRGCSNGYCDIWVGMTPKCILVLLAAERCQQPTENQHATWRRPVSRVSDCNCRRPGRQQKLTRDVFEQWSRERIQPQEQMKLTDSPNLNPTRPTYVICGYSRAGGNSLLGNGSKTFNHSRTKEYRSTEPKGNNVKNPSKSH